MLTELMQWQQQQSDDVRCSLQLHDHQCHHLNCRQLYFFDEILEQRMQYVAFSAMIIMSWWWIQDTAKENRRRRYPSVRNCRQHQKENRRMEAKDCWNFAKWPISNCHGFQVSWQRARNDFDGTAQVLVYCTTCNIGHTANERTLISIP